MDQTARERLLLMLHRGPAQTPAWSPFLEDLRVALGAHYANLIFRKGHDRAVQTEFSAGGIDMVGHRERYRADFATIDPVAYHAMEPGRSYRLAELMGIDRPEDHPYYRGYLQPAGLAHMLSAKVAGEGGYTAWLTVARKEEDGDFDSAQRDLFDGLLPHMSVALDSFALIDRQRVRAAVGQHLSGRFDLAAITVTAEGRVLGMGPAAASLIEQTHMLSVDRGGHLRFADRTLQRRLESALQATVTGGQSKAIVFLADEERIEMLVSRFIAAADHGSAKPDAVIYLHWDRSVTGPDEEVRHLLNDMFDLTPIESDIAQLLVQGRTMAQLAGDLGLAESTVRSYSKSIYGKLGVRRQVDLVRLLLQSVIRLI